MAVCKFVSGESTRYLFGSSLLGKSGVSYLRLLVVVEALEPFHIGDRRSDPMLPAFPRSISAPDPTFTSAPKGEKSKEG